MNFICAIHIDDERLGYHLVILEASNLTMLYDKMYRTIRGELDIDVSLPKGWDQDHNLFDTWIQEVSNLFEFCNIMYKIQYTKSGFSASQN